MGSEGGPLALWGVVLSTLVEAEAGVFGKQRHVVVLCLSTYTLVAIAKKRLNLPHSLHDILRQLDLNMFKTILITQLLGLNDNVTNETRDFMQKDLF
jgi:hypothetical protein